MNDFHKAWEEADRILARAQELAADLTNLRREMDGPRSVTVTRVSEKLAVGKDGMFYRLIAPGIGLDEQGVEHPVSVLSLDTCPKTSVSP